jgi:hypothetical protein
MPCGYLLGANPEEQPAGHLHDVLPEMAFRGCLNQGPGAPLDRSDGVHSPRS